MFNLISTKNLHLLELSIITKVTHSRGVLEPPITSRFVSNQKRYTLGFEKDEEFIDIFANSKYKRISHLYEVGCEGISKSKAIITTKKYITIDEALYVLENLNPTYLPRKTKTLKK